MTAEKGKVKATAFWLIMLAGAVFAINFGRQLSGDVYWHLKTGQWILTHRAFPFHDPFSYTASHTWILQEWGFQVLAYIISQFSLNALAWLSFLIVLSALFVSFATCLLRASRPTAFVITVLSAGVCADMVDIRAQTLGLLMFAILVFFVEKSLIHRKGLPTWLPLLFVVWANFHSSFTAGLVLLSIEWVVSLSEAFRHGDKREKYVRPLREFVLTTACALAALINPNGYHLYEFPLRTVGHGGMTSMIAEWVSPDFRSFAGGSLALFLLVIIWGMARTAAKVDLRHLVRLTIFMLAALIARRLGPFFALACAPIVAELISCHVDAALRTKSASRATALCVGVLILCGIVFRISDMQGMSAFDYITTTEVFPAAACDYILRERPPGEMFNELNYGSYLIWRLWPKYKVFVDNRNDIFYGGAFEEFVRVAMSGGNSAWREVFDRRRINLVIMPRESLLSDVLEESSEWQLSFSDNKAVVYTRVRPLRP